MKQGSNGRNGGGERECRRLTANIIPIKSVGIVCENINFSAFHANLMKFENWQKFIWIYFVVYFYFYDIQIVLRLTKKKNKSEITTKWLRRSQNGKLTAAKTFTVYNIIIGDFNKFSFSRKCRKHNSFVFKLSEMQSLSINLFDFPFFASRKFPYLLVIFDMLWMFFSVWMRSECANSKL